MQMRDLVHIHLRPSLSIYPATSQSGYAGEPSFRSDLQDLFLSFSLSLLDTGKAGEREYTEVVAMAVRGALLLIGAVLAVIVVNVCTGKEDNTLSRLERLALRLSDLQTETSMLLGEVQQARHLQPQSVL